MSRRLPKKGLRDRAPKFPFGSKRFERQEHLARAQRCLEHQEMDRYRAACAAAEALTPACIEEEERARSRVRRAS